MNTHQERYIKEWFRARDIDHAQAMRDYYESSLGADELERRMALYDSMAALQKKALAMLLEHGTLPGFYYDAIGEVVYPGVFSLESIVIVGEEDIAQVA